jgi:hypothetical protein
VLNWLEKFQALLDYFESLFLNVWSTIMKTTSCFKGVSDAFLNSFIELIYDTYNEYD